MSSVGWNCTDRGRHKHGKATDSELIELFNGNSEYISYQGEGGREGEEEGDKGEVRVQSGKRKPQKQGLAKKRVRE